MKLHRAAVLVLLALLPAFAAWAQTRALWTEPHSGIEFVRVDQGCFQMGTDHPGKGIRGELPPVPSPNETPRHEVCVDGFWLGKLELTRAQWQRVMAPALVATEQHPQLPALKVAWEDAQAFLLRLNAQAGATDGIRYRLPTEAEWEYACQAGGAVDPDPLLEDGAAMDAKLGAIAWYHEPSRYNPAARDTGEMGANGWGFYDMLGNAAEWVQDDFVEGAYKLHARSNPVVARDGARHVIRGGSFRSEVRNVRCGARNYGLPGDRMDTVGLRIVRTGRARP